MLIKKCFKIREETRVQMKLSIKYGLENIINKNIFI